MPLLDSIAPRRGLAVAWLASLALPVAAWLDQTGNPLFYFRYPMPSGQAWFVAAKLLGLVGLVMLWWQAMLGLFPQASARWLGAQRRLNLHRAHGLLVVLTMLAHAACFVTAASLRSGHVATQYLWPNWEGYYNTRVSLGLLGLLVLLAAVAQPLLLWARRRLMVPLLHAFGVLAFYLVAWHGLSIGSETRFPPLQGQILLMAALLTAALLSRLPGGLAALRPRPQPA
ncbi:hypothetical protein D0B54_13000 [Solimonas sp. K1W22B-7]|uniref:hypothetical protein n=1 Tax=Solimonas sp. K1W22B-7 TaxID=2303331 RepID=UPI000E32F7BB|nr:hypothetical protein [Solimonas sp. K1W22B-7]AXQ29554.1 hypothetical protein D0B54_13000 [Solimonas sp. K1W22B-7]